MKATLPETVNKVRELLADGRELLRSEIRVGVSRELTLAALRELQLAGEIQSICVGRNSGLGYRKVK